MPQAKAAVLKALEIDDSLAEAHAALGLYLANYAWDLSAGEKELRRAIELKPNYATAHHWLGNVPLVLLQKFDEAIAEGRRAEEFIMSISGNTPLILGGMCGELPPPTNP